MTEFGVLAVDRVLGGGVIRIASLSILLSRNARWVSLELTTFETVLHEYGASIQRCCFCSVLQRGSSKEVPLGSLSKV